VSKSHPNVRKLTVLAPVFFAKVEGFVLRIELAGFLSACSSNSSLQDVAVPSGSRGYYEYEVIDQATQRSSAKKLSTTNSTARQFQGICHERVWRVGQTDGTLSAVGAECMLSVDWEVQKI